MIRILLVICFLQACATVKPMPNMASTYRKDLIFDVNGKRYQGVAVVPKAEEYEIEITRSGGDYFSLSSCHRHLPITDPSRKIEYIYHPNYGIEDQGSCLVEMSMLDESGRHRWGIIDLVNDASLEANIQCNGRYYRALGASFCQSRAGLIQRIIFDSEVHALAIDACPINKISPTEYEIELNLGYCIFIFKQGDEFHRMTTFGYDDQIGEK